MMDKSRAAEVNAYGFPNVGNTAGGREAWSGEL